MAQTTALAATTSAANSSDITVTTTPLKVSMFMTGGNVQGAKNADGTYERVMCVIQEKDPNGVYVNVNVGGPPLNICRLHPQQVLVGPGTYRVVKPATVNAIGIYTENGA